MARKLVYTCDVCGVEKKETNHWFDLYQKNCALILEPLLVLEGDEVDFAGDPPIVMVCGQTCGLMVVSRWMEMGSLLAGIVTAKTEVMVAKTEVRA